MSISLIPSIIPASTWYDPRDRARGRGAQAARLRHDADVRELSGRVLNVFDQYPRLIADASHELAGGVPRVTEEEGPQILTRLLAAVDTTVNAATGRRRLLVRVNRVGADSRGHWRIPATMAVEIFAP
jgi:hypothetical protein